MKTFFEVTTIWNKEIKKEWSLLWEKAENANFYNSDIWFDICLNTFNYKDIKIVKCIRNNKLVAILPLYSSKEYGLQVYINPLSNNPILFLNKEKVLANAFVKFLKEMDNVILFELEESIVKDCALGSISVHSSDRPYISMIDIKKELVGKSFKKIRTRIRNIGANLKYRSKKADLNDIKIISKIESTSSKVDNKSDIFSSDSTKRLYKNFINIAKKHTFVGYMNYGEIPVVSDFYLIGKGTAHSTHTSFNKEFTRYWPGNLLQYKVLEEFIQRGDIDEVDLGRGINSLKMKFGTGVRKYYTTYLFANPVKRSYLLWIASLSKKAHVLKEDNKMLSYAVVFTKKILKNR